MKTSRLFYHFYVSHPLTSIAPYFSSTDRRAVFLLVRKQKTNQLDSHQRIQLTEITTSSLRSGSPVRQQLNFTLLMEETSCSLALSSEFVGNHKKELANNSTFFWCVFYCLYKSMLQCCRFTICYNFHCSLDFCANTCRLCTLER